MAVDDVSFDIKRGECLGLVGESGCGKTSLSKLIMRAMKPDRGSIIYNDGIREIDVLALRGQALRDFRPRLQMIFQDPVSSLSPRMTVLNIIREPLEIHGIGDPAEQLKRVGDLMAAVGLDRRFLNRYPPQFLGGAATAHLHRPDAGDEPGPDHLRRARLGPRRFGPGPGSEPAQGPEERARPHLPVHLPQPGRGRLYRGPDRGSGARPDRRDRPPAISSSPSRCIPIRNR